MKITNAFMDNKLAFALALSIITVGLSTAGAISYTATDQPVSDMQFSIPEDLDLEAMSGFTDAQKASATQIFLTNSDVQRMINGKPYEIAAIGVGTPDLAAKPPKFYITFNIAMEDKVLAGAVDLENRTVINLTESERTNLG
jgi:hypothetical protein